jgi:hypothetical protein
MTNIIAVKTKEGFYITENPSYETSLPKYLVNGKHPQPTFNKRWVFVKDEPKKIEKFVSHPSINYRYELIDTSMASDKIPTILLEDEATYHDDGERCWKEEYFHLRSLYVRNCDKQPDTIEPVDFALRVAMEVDTIKEPESFGYKAIARWDETFTITDKDVIRQVIDTMIFPDLLLPTRPCKMTSKQTFDIIRAHVKDNIDSRYAMITSDYDFCFTVKKKVVLEDPVSYQVDINNNMFSGRKKTPKYVTRNTTTRDYTIFEMTSKESAYKGYTIIAGFAGDNNEDLRQKIDAYLKDLMDFINDPVRECPQCKGAGILYEAKFTP